MKFEIVIAHLELLENMLRGNASAFVAREDAQRYTAIAEQYKAAREILAGPETRPASSNPPAATP